MSKFISKITARSSDKEKDDDIKAVPHSTLMSRRSSLKKSILSINTSQSEQPATKSPRSSSESINAKPVVKSPDWSVRYDPRLSVYYYVNDKANEIQFDHPDEVVSPTESPIDSTINNISAGLYGTDDRKFFSSSLKRSLSPRFLSCGQKSNSQPQIPRSSIENDEALINENIPKSAGKVAYDSDEMDEDIEEFRKQLELEMKTYECERLRST